MPPLVPYSSPYSSATFQSTFVSPVQQDKLPSVNVPFGFALWKVTFLDAMVVNPNRGIYQLSYDWCNVYYHAFNSCVSPCFNDFNPVIHIKVDCSVKDNLLVFMFSTCWKNSTLTCRNSEVVCSVSYTTCVINKQFVCSRLEKTLWCMWAWNTWEYF